MTESRHRPVDARTRLLALLRERAVLRGEFVLSSGAHSSYYLDARLVTLSAQGSGLVGASFLQVLPESGIDGVAGLTVGADPIVTAIALVAGLEGRALDAFIVRKERKGHGAGRQIEGPWREGARVSIVDDTLTTGRSSLEAAEVVEREGGRIEGIYALIDREQGARQAIEAAGHSFTSLFTASDLLSD